MSEPILATDAERDMALALLREASVDGRLTVEDLAQRAELVHGARTRDDLATATAGLERTPAPPPAGEDVRVAGTPPAGAPLVRIRHSGLLGSVTVRSRPRLTDEIKARLRRYL